MRMIEVVFERDRIVPSKIVRAFSNWQMNVLDCACQVAVARRFRKRKKANRRAFPGADLGGASLCVERSARNNRRDGGSLSGQGPGWIFKRALAEDRRKINGLTEG